MENKKDFDLEIFFPTKDRNESLSRCLKSIKDFVPNCMVTIANCSTNTAETSEILDSYKPMVNEIILKPNYGISESFRILIDLIKKKYCLWLSDDLILIKTMDEPIDEIERNENLKIVGLPFIDNIHYPVENWPKDEYGCNIWIMKEIRVANFALMESALLKSICDKVTPDKQIDWIVHDQLVNHSNYKFLNGNAFIIHDRYMDTTRTNRIL